MANIYKISAYGELSPGGTTRQLETYFVQSQPIYDYLTNNPPPFVINSSGEFSAVDVENEFKMVMGDSPFGKHIEVFCGLLENEGQPSIPFYGNVLNMCGFTPTYIQPVTYDPDTNIPMFYNCHLVNKNVDVGDLGYGRIHAGEYVGYQPASKFSYGSIEVRHDNTPTVRQLRWSVGICPSDAFSADGGINPAYLTDPYVVFPVMTITMSFNDDGTVCHGILGTKSVMYTKDINDWLNGAKIDGPGTVVDDNENPYGAGGTSGPGGGGGKYGDIDGIEATDIPDLPTINAAALGLVTLYNPTAATVNSLASYLWSGMFDPSSFKKLFADPMGCLIGLSVVPAIPSSQGSKNIMFGNVDSGINCSYLSTNYVNVDCGSVSIDEYVGSFLDYEPHVKLNLFLPYVGFVPLSADDIVGGSINVQYNVDVLSGHCVAFVKHSTRGVLYSYSGSCITNIPITAQSFSQSLQSYYSGLAGVAGSALGALGSGGAGLVSMAGQMASTAMNTAFNMHPNFQRSGGMGGAAAIMGVQTPFIVIQRPRFSVPDNVTRYAGLTSNMTRQLSGCHGFTMCEYVHLDGISATSEEIMEMESMLKQGVIL